jgi:hypothetical protein
MRSWLLVCPYCFKSHPVAASGPDFLDKTVGTSEMRDDLAAAAAIPSGDFAVQQTGVRPPGFALAQRV